MKKWILGLFFLTCSLFTMAATTKKEAVQTKAVQQTTSAIEQQKAYWGWVIVCIYNPVTGMFELHMIWVDDEM